MKKLLLLSILLIWGCSEIPAQPPTLKGAIQGSSNQGKAVVTSGCTLVPFGDSITAAAYLGDHDDSYVAQLNGYCGGLLVDYSVGNTGWFIAAKNSNNLSTTFTDGVITVMNGANDLARASGATTDNKITSCLNTLLINAFATTIYPSQGGTVTTSGSWSDTGSGTHGMRSVGGANAYSKQDAGAGFWQITGISGPNIGLVLLGGDGVTITSPTVTIKVDGSTIGTVNLNDRYDGVDDGLGNTIHLGPVGYLISGLSAATHTIRVEGDQYTAVNFVAELGRTKIPVVIMDEIYTPDYISTGTTDHMNSIVDAVYNQWRTAQFNVRRAPQPTLIYPGDYEMDGIHPTVGGQAKIFNHIKKFVKPITYNLSSSIVVFNQNNINSQHVREFLIQNTGTPAGGRASITVDATQAFSIILDVPTTVAEAETSLIYVDDTSGDDYVWSGKSFTAGFFIYTTIYYGTSEPSVTNSTITPTATTGKIKMYKSGNDVIIANSTDGVSYSDIGTISGALTGKTTLYLKCLFAAGTTQKVRVNKF